MNDDIIMNAFGDSAITADGHGPFVEGDYIIVVSGFSNADFGSFQLFLDGILLGWFNSLDELKAMIAQTSRHTVRLSGANTRNAVDDSFASRAANDSTGQQGLSGILNGNIYSWVKISGVKADSDEREFEMPLLQLGADIEISPSLIAGLSLGGSRISYSAENFAAEGSEWLIQPYLGWKFNGWYGTTTLTYGQQDYDEIETGTQEATAKGQLWAIELAAARDFEIGNDLTVTPLGSARAGVVKITETTGALDDSTSDDRVNFKELSLGANVSKPIGPGTLLAGVSADYFDTDAPIALISGDFDQTGLSGSATLGYRAEIGSGLNIDAELRAGGLGSDQRDYSGSLQIGYTF